MGQAGHQRFCKVPVRCIQGGRVQGNAMGVAVPPG